MKKRIMWLALVTAAFVLVISIAQLMREVGANEKAPAPSHSNTLKTATQPAVQE